MIDNVRSNRTPASERKPAEKFDFDVMRLINRYWLWIMLCVVVGWLLAGTYATITPPLYESQASIMLIPKDSNLAVQGVEGSRDASGGVINDDVLATHIMLIQSPKLVANSLSKVRTFRIENGRVVFLDTEAARLKRTSPNETSAGPTTASATIDLSSGAVTSTTGFSPQATQGAASNQASVPDNGLQPTGVAQGDSATEVAGSPEGATLPNDGAGSMADGEVQLAVGAEQTIKLEDLPSLKESKSSKDKTVANYVVRNLTVSRGGKGQSRDAQVITIAFQHTNQEDAQLVVAAIVDNFQSFLTSNFTSKNDEAAKLIQDASEKLGKELEQAQQDYALFRQNAPMLWTNEQSTNIYRLKYEQINVKLNELQLEKLAKAGRLDLVERSLEEINARGGSDLERLALIDTDSATRVGVFLQILYNEGESGKFLADQPVRVALAQSEFSQLMKLKAEHAAKALELGERNPQVVLLKESIDEYEKNLKQKLGDVAFDPEKSLVDPMKLVSAYVGFIKHDLETLAINEAALLKESELANDEAKKLISYELEGESLRLKLQQKQELFKETVDRLRDINLTKEYAGFINEILEDADIGEEVWPSMAICLVIGTLVGAGAAGAGILVNELRNRSLRSSADIEALTGATILSYVPRMNKHEDRKMLKEIEQRGSAVSPIVYTLHIPQSQEAEIFRGMRTSLFFKSAEVKGKVFAITSSNSGDGKSTITANLVCCMAQAGRKVLLIECDLRRPAVAALLGCGGRNGLSDVLNSRVDIKDAIQVSEAANLSVLSAGTIPENPAELLGSLEFKELIGKLEQEYDFIMLDCPPVLAVSDPCIVSDVADGVVVVVRVNPKSRVELTRTISMLKDVQATVVGTIVNASHLEDEGSIGKDGYYVGYGYGTYGERSNGYYTQRPAPSSSSKYSKTRKSKAED